MQRIYCGDALVVDLSGGQRPFSLRQITPVPQTMPRRTVWTNVRTSSLRASLARYLEGIIHLASPVIARQSTLRSHFSFNLSACQRGSNAPNRSMRTCGIQHTIQGPVQDGDEYPAAWGRQPFLCLWRTSLMWMNQPWVFVPSSKVVLRAEIY